MNPGGNGAAFKRAIYASLCVHVVLFLLILVSPSLPKSSKKGMVQYIPLTFVGPGGGGGGASGGGPLKAAPPPAKKETLRDLTVPQKVKEEPKPGLRYPVEKPKKETQPKTEKKAAITKPEPGSAETAKETAEAGGGVQEAPAMEAQAVSRTFPLPIISRSSLTGSQATGLLLSSTRVLPETFRR